MEHTEAVDTGAAERYALGRMGEDERGRYEEHFFDCADCADEVKSAALFLENAAAVAREDGSVLRRRLEPARAERGWKALFWPMPLGAAAALVLALGGPAAYLAFEKVPRLEQALAGDSGLTSARSHFLAVSRSTRPVIAVRQGETSAVLTLSRSTDRSFPWYRCELLDASRRAVVTSVVPAPPAQDELQVLLHTGSLEPGAYVLAVAGLDSKDASPSAQPAEYHFTLEREVRRE